MMVGVNCGSDGDGSNGTGAGGKINDAKTLTGAGEQGRKDGNKDGRYLERGMPRESWLSCSTHAKQTKQTQGKFGEEKEWKEGSNGRRRKEMVGGEMVREWEEESLEEILIELLFEVQITEKNIKKI